jgi:hypothetical protein
VSAARRTHSFGPDNATLTVRTGKTGAASKAGHNLIIEVTEWNARLAPDEDPAIELSVDSRSLRVLEGSGGIQALGDDDKDAIRQTIAEEVLDGGTISFRSNRVSHDGRALHVEGELTLAQSTQPVSFELTFGDEGRLTGSTKFKQTDFGMKPYSTLFGTLKVADEVEVVIDAKLASS